MKKLRKVFLALVLTICMLVQNITVFALENDYQLTEKELQIAYDLGIDPEIYAMVKDDEDFNPEKVVTFDLPEGEFILKINEDKSVTVITDKEIIDFVEQQNENSIQPFNMQVPGYLKATPYWYSKMKVELRFLNLGSGYINNLRIAMQFRRADGSVIIQLPMYDRDLGNVGPFGSLRSPALYASGYDVPYDLYMAMSFYVDGILYTSSGTDSY